MSEQQEDRIRERAYQIWEEEGRPEGDQEKHWRRAEAEFQNDMSDNASQRADTEGTTQALDPPVSPPSLTNPDSPQLTRSSDRSLP